MVGGRLEGEGGGNSKRDFMRSLPWSYCCCCVVIDSGGMKVKMNDSHWNE